MAAGRQSLYKTRDISIAAFLYAQGARLRSVSDRQFFLEFQQTTDAVEAAIGFIGSPEACYDQITRALKKVILEWDRQGLVGRQGRWTLEGRMEIAAFLCSRGARLVGFERIGRRGRVYQTHFDGDPAALDSIVAEWPGSSQKRFDDAVRSLKQYSRTR